MRKRAGDIAAWAVVFAFVGCFNCTVTHWFADARVVNETDRTARVALESGERRVKSRETLVVDVAPGGSVEYSAITAGQGIVKSQASSSGLGAIPLNRYWPRRAWTWSNGREIPDRPNVVRLRVQDGSLIARHDADTAAASESDSTLDASNGQAPASETEMKETPASGASSGGGAT